MEQSYRRRHSARRSRSRRGGSAGGMDDKTTRRRTIKLAACGIIFALAALTKLLFPSFVEDIGGKLTTAVDYKAALAALGEGISGDKKFTTAIGEAITYAFRGTTEGGAASAVEENAEGENVSGDAGEADGAAEAFGEDEPDIPVWDYDAVQPDAVDTGDTANVAEEAPDDLANAIISAFLQTQDEYSDYKLPAGTTFDMPVIGTDYTAPVTGKITSPFGYRVHPTDGNVKFHYGIDLASDKGTPVNAFAGGSVLAVGESTTLGKYVIITHDGLETLYAHCDDVLVSSGQAVKMGDTIAAVGSTGNATSNCLHFELKVGGVFVNPGYYIEAI